MHGATYFMQEIALCMILRLITSSPQWWQKYGLPPSCCSKVYVLYSNDYSHELIASTAGSYPIFANWRTVLYCHLFVALQPLPLTVELQLLPVGWLCLSHTVLQWTQWYFTSVSSQGLLHHNQAQCVEKMGGGVQTPPKWRVWCCQVC